MLTSPAPSPAQLSLTMTNSVGCLGMKAIVVEMVGWASSSYAGNTNSLLEVFQTVAGVKCVEGENGVEVVEVAEFVKKGGYEKIELTNLT